MCSGLVARTTVVGFAGKILSNYLSNARCAKCIIYWVEYLSEYACVCVCVCVCVCRVDLILILILTQNTVT